MLSRNAWTVFPIVLLAAAGAAPLQLAGETCGFKREIRLAPGEYYAVRYDPQRREFVEEEPDRPYSRLGKEAILQVLRAPGWLREDLADRLADLAFDDVRVSSKAAPVFHDVNGDGRADLVTGSGDGAIRCFLAPDFREDSAVFAGFKAPGASVPCFFDLDKDGSPDLIVGDSCGGLCARRLKGGEAIAIPGNLPFSGQVSPAISPAGRLLVCDSAGKAWEYVPPAGFRDADGVKCGDNGSLAWTGAPAGGTLLVAGMRDGTLSASGLSEKDRELVQGIGRMRVAGDARPVFHDLDGDGAPELVVGSADGTVSVFPNRGRSGNPWFAVYSQDPPARFKCSVGFMSTPRIADMDGDGSADLVSGSQDGTVRFYPGPGFEERAGFFGGVKAAGSSAPATGDFDGDGRIDLAVGGADGSIAVFMAPGFKADEARSRGLRVASYAAPCAADIDLDGRADLVAGSGDGKIVLFRNLGDRFEEKEGAFAAVDAGAFPYPAAADADGDGDTDLVTGNRAGEIRLFLGPSWERAPAGIGVSMTGAYSAPAIGDLDSDGDPDLVVGSIEGGFIGFEREGGAWIEKGAWRFEPSMGLEKVTDYFDRCHVQSGNLRGRNDDEALEAVRKVLAGAEDRFFDEVAFSAAHMPTEVLRAMARAGEADVLVENAKCIYETAEKVRYAEIVEKEGYTTLSVVGKGGAAAELPRDVYYWWIVHPRLYTEVPLRVNASFWEKDAAAHGMSEEAWNRREIDWKEIGKAAGGTFWRRYLVEDRKYGKNLMEAAAGAETMLEAVYLVGDWVSQAMPESWFTYGRQSQDLQPNVIYQKNYGSCGEASTLGAACARAMLIPAGCSGCGGEDHIWNEFWMDGKWWTWDLCAAASKIRWPWECCEGAEHKGTQILTVTRRRGDDLVEATTTLVTQPPGCGSTKSGTGYTDVGRVAIRVVDADGRPVEGAAVVVRSDCQQYWRTSVWDYTDPAGECVLELGRPARRCMIDIVAQQGLTGTAHLPVEENGEHLLTYVLPGRFGPPGQAPAPFGTGGGSRGPSFEAKVEVSSEEQRPRNLQTARKPPKEETEFYRKTGYCGILWYGHPNRVKRGVEAAILAADQFERLKSLGGFGPLCEIPTARRLVDGSISAPYSRERGQVALFVNPNRFTHVRFRVEVAVYAEASAPEITLEAAPERGTAGETLVFEGRAEDNLHVAKLEFSPDGGASWQDATESLDRSTGRFRFCWRTGEGGPALPGKRAVLFRATDGSGLASATPAKTLVLEGGRSFLSQAVFQDNPDSPLPKSSWVLGPFTLRGRERFIGIRSRSGDAEFDMDMFLFHDKNGNRKLDGMGEEKAKSTTPEAAEKIALDDPPAGVYWLHCQGWQVKERPGTGGGARFDGMPAGKLLALSPDAFARESRFALLDVFLSFDWDPVLITDIRPLGTVPSGSVEIGAVFAAGQALDASGVRVLIDGRDMTSRARIGGGSVSLPLDGVERDREVRVEIEARTAAGLADRASWTFRTAYMPIGIETSLAEGEKSLTVVIKGLGGRVLEAAEARCRAKGGGPTGDWKPLEPAAGGLSARGTLPLEGLKKGEFEVEVRFRSGGREETQTAPFSLAHGPAKAKLLWLYPENGARVFDSAPAMSAIVLGAAGRKARSVRLFLDGAEITSSCRVFGGCAKYFPDRVLALGSHVLEAEAALEDGSVLKERSEFTVSVMGGEEY